MALGNFNIKNFTPQKRSTAADLLKVTAPTDEKKEERFQIRIQIDVLQTFKEICKASGTDASKVLRRFITQTVEAGRLME